MENFSKVSRIREDTTLEYRKQKRFEKCRYACLSSYSKYLNGIFRFYNNKNCLINIRYKITTRILHNFSYIYFYFYIFDNIWHFIHNSFVIKFIFLVKFHIIFSNNFETSNERLGKFKKRFFFMR